VNRSVTGRQWGGRQLGLETTRTRTRSWPTPVTAIVLVPTLGNDRVNQFTLDAGDTAS
jgi:hypothetical protein